MRLPPRRPDTARDEPRHGQDRGVDVGAHAVGHDRAVHDPQPGHAAHPAVRIDDGHRVVGATHPAGARDVLPGHDGPLQVGIQGGVAGQVLVRGQDPLQQHLPERADPAQGDAAMDRLREPGCGRRAPTAARGRWPACPVGSADRSHSRPADSWRFSTISIRKSTVPGSDPGTTELGYSIMSPRMVGAVRRVARGELQPGHVGRQTEAVAEPPLDPRLGVVPDADAHARHVRHDRDAQRRAGRRRARYRPASAAADWPRRRRRG